MSKNNVPLISVVMPTYNQAHFIKDAIESVLNQTYNNFELIIVDNYSKDNTEQIVKSFVDPRIKYFKFSNHGIIAASRNLGIRNSKGGYLAFIDSDDAWLPNKLDIQAEYLEQNPHISLVFSLLKVKSSDERYNNKLIATKGKSRSGFMYNQLLNFNFIVCSSVMLKAPVLVDVGCFDEDPEIVASEDWDLWLRIARKYEIAFIAKELGIYRMHNSSMSMDGRRAQKALHAIEKHLKKGWAGKFQSDRARANVYFREGWNCLGSDNMMSRSFFYNALKHGKRYPRIHYVSLLGLFLSRSHFFCNLIKKRSVDKKIGNRIFNPQNL